MSKASIAAALRKKRKEAGLAVKEVKQLLLGCGTFVSEKTIYGWENAYSQPDADTLMLLCKLYDVHNVLETFGYADEKKSDRFHLELSRMECEVILGYRAHVPLQPVVQRILEVEIPPGEEAVEAPPPGQ